MRTLAQIISLTVEGRTLKPRGGLKWLHKRYSLLQKRYSAAPCPLQHPSRWPLTLQQILFKAPLLSQQRAAHGRQFPASSPCLGTGWAILFTGAVCHWHRALAGGAAGTIVAGVPHFQPCSAFPMPEPWLCPRRGIKLRAQLTLYPELKCSSRLINAVVALLHVRAGWPQCSSRRAAAGSPWSSVLDWRCGEPLQISRPLLWISETQMLWKCPPDAMPEGHLEGTSVTATFFCSLRNHSVALSN